LRRGGGFAFTATAGRESDSHCGKQYRPVSIHHVASGSLYLLLRLGGLNDEITFT
jgi:hypothetical protein